MDQNKTVRLNIRLTEDLKNKIQAKAKEENRTMSNYLENLVKKDLEKGEKEMLVKNLVDGTIYASGKNDDELINDWNKNIKKNLQWLLDESTMDNQEAYDELTEEAYRMENIEAVIRELNDMSDNNDIQIVEG